MSTAITDDASIAFIASFYRALGFGRSIQESFNQGKTALLLAGIPEENTPELLMKPGVDPNKIILIDGKKDDKNADRKKPGEISTNPGAPVAASQAPNNAQKQNIEVLQPAEPFKKDNKRFWETLPGILSGSAAVLTAVGGLIAIFSQFGWVPSSSPTSMPTPLSIPTDTVNSVITPTPTQTPISIVLATQDLCQKDITISPVFQEQNGEVIIDAKHCSFRIPGREIAAQHMWEERKMDESCSGTALRSYPNNGKNTDNRTVGPAALYNINFHTSGKFFIYVRGSAGESFTEGDRAVNDSILIGIKPTNESIEPELVSANGTGLAGFARDKFSWQSQVDGMDAIINIPRTGEYTLYVWMREDGVIIDRIWLSSIHQTPEGCNQSESQYS